MKCLSIKQPWAWAILNLGKDIENRDWRTNFRGRFLIHAGKGFDVEGYRWLRSHGHDVPIITAFERGGIVGSAVLRDCVRASESKWFFGEFGFVLQGARSSPFVPMRGQLGFFDVPDNVIPESAVASIA